MNIQGAQTATIRGSRITATSTTRGQLTTIQSANASPLMTDTTVSGKAPGADSVSGLVLSSGSPVIENSRVTATDEPSSIGISTATGTTAVDVTVRGTSVVADQALYAAGGSISFNTGELRTPGDTVPYSAVFVIAGGTINVADSLMRGIRSNFGGQEHCFGDYRPDFVTAVTASCD